MSLAEGKATLEGLVEWFLTTSNKAPATCNASDLRIGGTAPTREKRQSEDSSLSPRVMPRRSLIQTRNSEQLVQPTAKK